MTWVFKLFVLTLLAGLLGTGCSARKDAVVADRLDRLKAELAEYIEGKDAKIGVAVIYDGTDTVSVNGGRDFPMLSVYKFPQALAVADYCLKNGMAVSDTIAIKADSIRTNTWSPMREKHGVRNLGLPLSELLEYSVGQSDNNACDILFALIGGPNKADSLMKAMGHDDISIRSTEDEMHRDPMLCNLNTSTPVAMAALFDEFYRQDMFHQSSIHEAIGAIMLSCSTGVNRLPAPLAATNAVIGHKTGTGDVDGRGRIMAVNDAGMVFLPNRHGYAIAVFVADSAYDMESTEKIIADISDIVFRSLAES